MDHREYQVDDVNDDNPSSVFCEECTNIVSRSSAEQVYDEFIGQMVWKCKGCLSPEEEGTMIETQYCDICKTDHPVDAFRYIGGGWQGTRNWYTLECLNTGELFTCYYDEQTDEEE